MTAPATYVIRRDNGRVRATDTDGKIILEDTNARRVIQRSIDILPSEGGTVYVHAGEYQLDRPIRIDRDYVKLEGAGFGFWSQFNRGDPGYGTDGPGMTKLVCTKQCNAITIAHAEAGDVTDGIGGRTKGITLSNLYLYGNDRSGTGIHIEDFSDQPIVEQILVHNFNVGVDADTDSGHFEQVTVMDCGYAGVTLRGFQGTVRDCCIADNNHDDEGAGIIVHTESAIVTDNTFVRCNRGVWVTPGERLLQYDDESQSDLCILANNQFKENRGDVIHLDATDDATVRGNQIQVKESSRVEAIGIHIDQSNRCIVTENHVRNDADDDSMRCGIRVDKTSDDGIIAQNIISGEFGEEPIQAEGEYSKNVNISR